MIRIVFVIASVFGIAAALAAPAQDAEFPINSYTAGDQQRPAVARAPGGGFVVVWDSDEQDGSLGDVYARRYAADGAPLGDEFRVNTTARNRQYAPRVAIDADGGFVVGWLSNAQNGVGLSIYARRYDATGVPLADEFRVDSTGHATAAQFDMAMAPDGRFVAVWVDALSLVGASLQTRTLNAQRYAPDGSLDGAVIEIYQSSLLRVRTPSVACDAAGNFVAAWFIGANSIWARRYNAGGEPRGLAFRISSVNSPNVDRPQIASAADGAFAIAWETADDEFQDTGVYLRAYTADGRASMPATRADARLLRNPEISFVGSDRFVVAAHGEAIYAQCFAVAGDPYSAQRIDSSPTLYTPLFAGVASDRSGQLLFAWQNFMPGVHGRDIYARLAGGC